MTSAIFLLAWFSAGIFSEGAPHGSETPANLADGPALLLYLGLILLVGLILIWNALSYQAPQLAHGAHADHGTHQAHSTEAEMTLERTQEAEVEVETPAKDDLKIIEGIGPKTEAVFNAAGLFSFRQVASTPVEKLDEILDAAGLRLGDPGSWPEQARLAAEGDWEGLKQLQERLKGGRVV
jgi:predicted flap endonuclease-1-like 5' DNA nuclease